jgi:hypothetical protein
MSLHNNYSTKCFVCKCRDNEYRIMSKATVRETITYAKLENPLTFSEIRDSTDATFLVDSTHAFHENDSTLTDRCAVQSCRKR